MTSPPVLKLNSFNKQIKTAQSCLKGEALWRVLYRPRYSQQKAWPICKKGSCGHSLGTPVSCRWPFKQEWGTEAGTVLTVTYISMTIPGCPHTDSVPTAIDSGRFGALGLPDWNMRFVGGFCHKQKTHNQNLFTFNGVPAGMSMVCWQQWVKKERTRYSWELQSGQSHTHLVLLKRRLFS